MVRSARGLPLTNEGPISVSPFNFDHCLMTLQNIAPLLAADEPAPVILRNADGGSPFFFTCDHYGRRIPRALGDLGIDEDERGRTSPTTSASPASPKRCRTRSARVWSRSAIRGS